MRFFILLTRGGEKKIPGAGTMPLLTAHEKEKKINDSPSTPIQRGKNNALSIPFFFFTSGEK